MIKYISPLIGTLIFLYVLSSCSTQNSIANQKTASLLESGEFTFLAENANPFYTKEIYATLLSNQNMYGSKISNLDDGYTVEIKKNEIKVFLPYFGKWISKKAGQEPHFIQLSSKDFNIENDNEKKGTSVYEIILNDQTDIKKMYLNVFENGKSNLSIASGDRQPISYDGYVMKNAMQKKEK